MSDRQKRSHKQINYNEKAPVVGGGAPAWVKLQSSQAELIKSERKLQGKENSKDPSANQQHPEGTQAKKQAKPAAGSGKAAKAQKLPQRGRDAGIEHVPIVDKAKQALDAKAAAGVPQPQAASGRLRRGASAGTGSGEDSERERPRLVPREVPVPGLPHVRQKRLDPAPKAAASAEPATAAESNPAAPPEQPEQQQQHASDDERAPSNSGKQGSAGSGRKGNGGKSKHLKIASSGRKRAASDPGVRAAEKQPAAKRQRARSSGGHKVTAAAEPRKGGEEQALPSAHLAAGASNAARGAIVVTPPQQLQPEHASAGVVGGPAVEPDMAAGQGNRATDVLERATRAVQAARQAEEAAAAVPPPQSCQLCHHFSDNFAALITEFQELQRQYEALKKGRLEAELEAVLKEQNRKVQEHGMRAGELAKAWKEEADKRAADAEQYTGLLARCQELEGEVLQAQAELTEVQAASLAKDTRIRELETSLQLLQRHVRVPQTHDQDIQTGGPAALSAGVQAPSLQPASSPGVQMLEARALAPEGALGTVYKKGRPSAWRGEEGSAAGAPADVTYSLPATTLAPALAARLAGEAEPEQHLLQGEQGAAGSVHGQTEVRQQQVLSPQHYQQENELYQDQGGPAVVGAGAATSDMQLTGEPQPPTAAQAAAGTGHEERMPVAGRLAHAAAASRPGVRRASLAPAPVLSSPLPPAQQQAAAAVAVQPERPPSAQETAESLMHAAPGQRQDVLLPHMPAQPRGRRLSAPPVFGGFTVAAAAPLERQLQFTASISPQQQTAGGMLGRLATLAEAEEEGEQGQTGAPVPASVPPPPREGAVMMLGFEATPCKGGKYIFTDRPSGFAFELGPALPDVPGSDEEEAPPSTGAGTEPELCYKALNVGSIGHVLPEFLHGQILIKAKFRSKLLHLITEALAKATPGPQQR